MVVHSEDGLDEISLAADTHVAELKDGKVTTYTLQPEQLGFERGPLEDLAVDGAEASLQLISQALGGERDERSQRAAHLVALNAGAALYVAGVAGSIAEGAASANDILARGAGLEKMQQLADMTRGF
jgi:anthranilate phosphoribosyltransferase